MRVRNICRRLCALARIAWFSPRLFERPTSQGHHLAWTGMEAWSGERRHTRTMNRVHASPFASRFDIFRHMTVRCIGPPLHRLWPDAQLSMKSRTYLMDSWRGAGHWCVRRIGFSNALFPARRHPEHGRTGAEHSAQRACTCLWRRLRSVGRGQPSREASFSGAIRGLPLVARSLPSVRQLPGRSRPQRPWLPGSPERSRLGSVRPLAAPDLGPAHEAVPAPASPGA